MFPGYMLIFHLGRKGEGGMAYVQSFPVLGSCEIMPETLADAHYPLEFIRRFFILFSFHFSILSGLASTFTSSNPGSWFLGSVSLHATHTRDG